MLRKAHQQRAQIVILECMAVQPELQRICQEQIVQSEITVITNVRRDHMFELGETLEEVAQSFSSQFREMGPSIQRTKEPPNLCSHIVRRMEPG